MTAEILKKRSSHGERRTLKPARLAVIGANVAERRRTLGIEQNDFAKRIKIRNQVLRDFELGHIHLHKDTMKLIAQELNCTVLELHGM